MKTLSMTAGDDNALIWFVKIELENSTLRYCMQPNTSSKSLTNTWTGDIVAINSLSNINERIDFYNHDGIGSVRSFEIKIANKTGTFMGSFYPTTSAAYIINRKISLGFGWTGITSDSEITWDMYGFVESYNYDNTGINLFVVEGNFFDYTMLPYYVVQNNYDDGISYFTGANEDVLGTPLPITYGAFNIETGNISIYKLAPIIIVNKDNLTCLIGTYYAYTLNNIWKRVGSNYIEITSSDPTTTKTWAYSTIKLHSDISNPATLTGSLEVQLKLLSRNNESSSITNATDKDDTTTYDVCIQGNKLALKSGVLYSTSEVGYLGASANDVMIVFVCAEDMSGTRSYTINYTNNTLSTPADGTGTTGSVTGTTPANYTYGFGASTTSKQTTALPWLVEEVLALDYWIRDDDVGFPGTEIYVYNVFLVFNNIKIEGLILQLSGQPLKQPDVSSDPRSWEYGGKKYDWLGQS